LKEEAESNIEIITTNLKEQVDSLQSQLSQSHGGMQSFDMKVHYKSA